MKPISLEKVTLHEIGHTLRNYFAFGREQIVVAMMHDGPECWHRATALLQEISPHYLGNQAEMIGPTLLANKLKAETEKTWEAKKDGNKFGFDIGREIFAELVRHFYLEPVLERKPKMFEKTGFYELDDLCMTLIEESSFALTQTPKPLAEERELD